MIEFLKWLFAIEDEVVVKPCKEKVTSKHPKLSPLEKTVHDYLRKNKPAHSADLHKLVGNKNLSSVIQVLRMKGYVIETKKRGKLSTYLLRNRKCR